MYLTCIRKFNLSLSTCLLYVVCYSELPYMNLTLECVFTHTIERRYEIKFKIEYNFISYATSEMAHSFIHFKYGKYLIIIIIIMNSNWISTVWKALDCQFFASIYWKWICMYIVEFNYYSFLYHSSHQLMNINKVRCGIYHISRTFLCG